jgi:hypothetical protein
MKLFKNYILMYVNNTLKYNNLYIYIWRIKFVIEIVILQLKLLT